MCSGCVTIITASTQHCGGALMVRCGGCNGTAHTTQIQPSIGALLRRECAADVIVWQIRKMPFAQQNARTHEHNFFFSCWSICTLLHTRILVMDACAVSTSSCETYMHSCKWREYIYMAPYRDTATSMKLQNILTVVDESTLNWALRLRPPLIVPSGKPTKLPLRTRIVGHGGNNQCAACTWACDLRLVDLSHTHTITDQKYVIWKHVARTL